MPKIQDSGDMRVALLYPTAQHGGHLRDALNELGAAVVYETAASNIDRDALENSGARTVVVNLGPDSDDYIDQLYDVLDAGDYNVVFNEANVTEALQGWDHARWARNLAAKILSRPDIATPPRPPGAEAVPTPVQKSASNVPVADKPSDFTFAPIEPPTRIALKPVSEAALHEIPEVQKPAQEEFVTTKISSERPTIEMQVPEEFRVDEPGSEGVGIVELGEFAEGADVADELSMPPEPVAASQPVRQERADDDFAAELDALFAAADNAKPVGDELDIGLPADFDLADMSIPVSPVVEESIAYSADDISAPADSNMTELKDEFPAIFDQLDVAAASVPHASDDTFKLAARPERDEVSSAEPLLPPDWSLEDVEEPSDAATPAAPFGVEKMSATEYLAPAVEEGTAKQQATLPKTDGGLTLELMPMEEAVAPQQQSSNYESEAWLDGSRPAQKISVAGTASAGVKKVFVLGASIGGPEAVRDFLGALPVGFPMLFILAQHMGEEFLELMSTQLRKSITLTVRNPTHGEHVGHGEVLIVPTTHRLQVDRDGVVTLAHLSEKPPYSPSIDLVLRDVADQFGADAGAIVFSGMAHDAIEGSKYLKEKGGVIWVQDPETCVISSMVDGAREAGIVSFTGSPSQLAAKLIADFGHG
ncbi:MAG: chemotaxis protein CheB [Rudaea sp.]